MVDALWLFGGRIHFDTLLRNFTTDHMTPFYRYSLFGLRHRTWTVSIWALSRSDIALIWAWTGRWFWTWTNMTRREHHLLEWRSDFRLLLLVFCSPARTNNKVITTGECVTAEKLRVSKFWQGDQSIVLQRVTHILCSKLICHSWCFINKNAEILPIFDTLYTEYLRLGIRGLLAICKELIQRCWLLEKAKRSFAPQK